MPHPLLGPIVALLAASSVVAMGAAVQQPPTTASAAPIVETPRTVQPFSEWLADFRKEALAQGISRETVDLALEGLEPLPIVVERDRTQAEQTQTIDQYLARRIDARMVRTAREMAARHATLLARVAKTYGVPSSIIVAIWGLESNFGRFSGVRPTIAALATLAHDHRRAAMFRQELLDALRIVDRGDIELPKMKGSWAGAMGQPQFMPSSYLRYAVDFDRDGRRDIWGTSADIFASVGNYLQASGWQTGVGWGRAVTVTKSAAERLPDVAPLRTRGCEAVRQMTEALPVARWRELGVTPKGPQAAPRPDVLASLVRAGTHDYLVFDNYSALLQYNCAHAYALSVALLADRIAPPPSTPVRKK